jgi:outer membrane protein OmpA-like peptidoglycan-associated protein
MRTTQATTRRAWATVALPLVVGAAVSCAGTRVPPRELTEARDELFRAREAAGAIDPTDVHEADVALANAERAWRQDPGSPSSLDLAIVALRRGQIAEAEAQAAQALKRAEVAKRQMHDLALSQLQVAQGQLGRTERQLDETQNQLQRQQQETATQRQQLLDMEARLKDARATIAKIASVKDDERGMVITIQSELLFKTGKSDLKPAAMAKLDQIAEALKGKEQPIHVLGYTDSVGARDFNMDLSQRRASAVRDYLVGKGIPQDLVRGEGKGPDDPASDNTSVEGRASNRRVEIVVEPKK